MRKDSAVLRNLLILGATIIVMVIVSVLIAKYVV